MLGIDHGTIDRWQNQRTPGRELGGLSLGIRGFARIAELLQCKAA
jgi:phosphoglycerate dehydrogenase-like enzyme